MIIQGAPPLQARIPPTAQTPDFSGYPRVMLHEGINSSGYPLIANGQLDTSMVPIFAKWARWSVEPNAIYDTYPSALAAVRAAAPVAQRMAIYAHVLGPVIWQVTGTSSFFGRVWNTIYSSGYFLRDSTDTSVPWTPNGPGTAYVDLSNASAVSALVDLYTELVSSGYFDGLFIDWMAPSDTWILSSYPHLYLAPWSGSSATWDAAMQAGKKSLFDQLRARFPNLLMFGNGGAGGTYAASANGWWRENFPNQPDPVTGWNGNMTGASGLLGDAARYSATPSHMSVLAIASTWADPARMLQGTVSACLADGGVVVVGPGNYDNNSSYRTWWHPLWGRDRTLGTDTGRHTGWLGQPTESAHLDGDGYWRRVFQYGTAYYNPTSGLYGLTPS